MVGTMDDLKIRQWMNGYGRLLRCGLMGPLSKTKDSSAPKVRNGRKKTLTV